MEKTRQSNEFGREHNKTLHLYSSKILISIDNS